MNYYAIMKNKNNNYWKLLLSQLLPNLCQFSRSAIISENSEDIVSWLFYLKQFLSESFSARSVLGKPCSKQVSSTELIDFYCQNKKTSIELKTIQVPYRKFVLILQQ